MLTQFSARLIIAAPVALFALAIACPALADPCEAIQPSGALPAWVKPGAPFAGQVRYVIDGDSLCVGSSPNPGQWVEVRLADFYAAELRAQGGPEAKALLQRLAGEREIQCVVAPHGRVRSFDRIVATCRFRGHDLSDLMRAAGAVTNRN
ncbi:MAG: nuclease [Caulobacter sp.]|nr:nuclease [Caulobacter sp.]